MTHPNLLQLLTSGISVLVPVEVSQFGLRSVGKVRLGWQAAGRAAVRFRFGSPQFLLKKADGLSVDTAPSWDFVLHN